LDWRDTLWRGCIMLEGLLFRLGGDRNGGEGLGLNCLSCLGVAI
jgi:hypothetical protein